MVIKCGSLWKHPSLLSTKIGRTVKILLNVDLSVLGFWSEGHCKGREFLFHKKLRLKNRVQSFMHAVVWNCANCMVHCMELQASQIQDRKFQLQIKIIKYFHEKCGRSVPFKN